VDLVSHHLDLFRQTKTSIDAKVFEILSTEEREESLKTALKKMKKLHPALISPDSEYKVYTNLIYHVYS
jgi:sorting nexin-13